MGSVRRVLQWIRATIDGEHQVPEVQVAEGGHGVTVIHYAPPGLDAAPMEGDTVLTTEATGSGQRGAVGYVDTRNEGRAKAGEFRFYSRNADGEPVTEFYLRADGSIEVTSESGQLVTINGVTIDTDGNVSAPGEVTAMAETTARSVGLSTHLHPTAMGPSDAATPGT